MNPWKRSASGGAARARRAELSTMGVVASIFLLLVVVAALLNIFHNSTRGVERVGEVVSCGSAGSFLGGSGECLPAGECQARPGWQKAPSVADCPKRGGEELTCCILTEPERWFTPGSLIITTNNVERKVLPTEKGSRPSSSGGPVRVKKGGGFLISYVPQFKTDDRPASDASSTKSGRVLTSRGGDLCKLFVKELGSSEPFSVIENCASAVEGPEGRVVLWQGTTTQFFTELKENNNREVAMPEGGYSFRVVVKGEGTQSQSRLVPEEKTYEHVLLIS